MYLKVRTENDRTSWAVFEGHHFHWVLARTADLERMVHPAGIECHLYIKESLTADKPDTAVLIDFVDTSGQRRYVATVFEAYLVNERGTTLERLL